MLTSTSDRRPEARMTFRFYRPEDRDAVLQIFKKQALDVYLPLPGEDPATSIGVVGEVDGEIKIAFFLRDTYELHLVADEDTPNLPYTVRRMGHIAEGAALQNGVERGKLKFAIPTDAVAFVPKSMPRMIDFMKEHLGFVDEATDKFHMLVKRLGA